MNLAYASEPRDDSSSRRLFGEGRNARCDVKKYTKRRGRSALPLVHDLPAFRTSAAFFLCVPSIACSLKYKLLRPTEPYFPAYRKGREERLPSRLPFAVSYTSTVVSISSRSIFADRVSASCASRRPRSAYFRMSYVATCTSCAPLSER